MIQDERIGYVYLAVYLVRRIRHFELMQQPAIDIHQKRPISGQGVTGFVRVHLIINRNRNDMAVIDPEFGLQVLDVVRQLATVLGSEIAAVEYEHARHVPKQLGKLLDTARVVR